LADELRGLRDARGHAEGLRAFMHDTEELL
jgi:hypothetical protein